MNASIEAADAMKIVFVVFIFAAGFISGSVALDPKPHRFVAMVKTFVWGTTKLVSYICWFPIFAAIWIALSIVGFLLYIVTDREVDIQEQVDNWDRLAWQWIKSFYTDSEIESGVHEE